MRIVRFKTAFILSLLITFSIAVKGQKEIFATSGNGKYFGSIEKAKKESDLERSKFLFELKYFRLDDQSHLFSYRYNAYNKWDVPKKLLISPDGKTVAIVSNSGRIRVINVKSKSLIAEMNADGVAFPHYANYFIVYNRSSKSFKAYDTFNAKQIGSYDRVRSDELWISENDLYLISRKGGKFQVWRTDDNKIVKTINANDFSFDYVNDKITFIKGLRTYTYSLKSMKLLRQRDFKYSMRDFIKKKRKENRKNKIEYENGLISNSGNFLIVPYSENGMSSLMLYSTQRDESRRIPTDYMTNIKEVGWLNDSILILNHEDNTTTLLDLIENKSTVKLNFGLKTKKFIKHKDIEISPDYNFYVSERKNIFSKNLLLNNPYSSEKKLIKGKEFISYTSGGEYLILRDKKSNRYEFLKLKETISLDENIELIPLISDSTSKNIKEEAYNDLPAPADHNPYKITAFKHISELKDSVALVNLILKNVVITDSIVSLNTHLIDDKGVYYYGASSAEWKHIWCNLILKSNGNPIKQITDFEIIEHSDSSAIKQSIAIVMDHSGSMGEDRALKLQDAIEKYIESKPSNDSYSLIKFDDRVRIESYPSYDKVFLKKKLKKTGLKGFGGGTSMLDGANAGISMMKRKFSNFNRSIIVLTDGFENSSFISKKKLIYLANNFGINIFIIGYGYNVEESFLESIAYNTNGSYYRIYDKDDFKWIFKDIELKIKNYYEIKFNSGSKGRHQAVLKICATNNQDTVGVSFDTSPGKEITKKTEYNESPFDFLPTEEVETTMKDIPDLSNFEKVNGKLLGEESIVRVENKKGSLQQQFEEILLPDVKFEHSTTKIISASLSGIDEVFDFLQEHKSVAIEISGHTDSEGEESFNQELSEKRAEKVKLVLVDMGIDSDRIKTVGLGETKPLVPNTSVKNKQINRRVEFRILE